MDDPAASSFVINGSYFALHGTPDTPFLSDGVLLGPAQSDARQGAFVAAADSAGLHDLAHETWQAAFHGADDALVSYPLLVGGNPAEHAITPSDWLANRSFVGQDSAFLGPRRMRSSPSPGWRPSCAPHRWG